MLLPRIALLVALALTPVGAVEVFNTKHLEAEQAQAAAREARDVAAVLRGDKNRLIANLGDVLQAAAIPAEQATVNPAACRLLLARLGRGHLASRHIRLLDAGFVVRCANDPSALATSMADHPEIVAAARSGDTLVVGHFEYGPFAEEGALRLALGWRAPDGASGVIVTQLGLEALGRFLTEQPLPQDAQILVVDHAQRVVAAAPAASSVGQTLPRELALVVQTALAGGAAADKGLVASAEPVAWLDGSAHFVAASLLSDTPDRDGVILVGISAEKRLAGLHAVNVRSSLVFAVASVAAILLAIWGGAVFVSRPMHTLEGAVRRWRDGDRNARAMLPSKTGLTRLGRAFDEMADAIAEGDRQAQENLRIIQSFMEATPNAMFVEDTVGRPILGNSAYRSIKGLDANYRSSLDGEIALPGMAEVVKAARLHVIANGTAFGFDLEFPEKGTGRIRIYHTVYAPIFDHTGEIFAIAGVGHDVTESRESAELLRTAKETAEEANRSKTRFLAAASHDLRQPLQGAILFAEAALARVIGPADAVDAVGQCVHTLGDMSILLESLMDVSRLDAGVVPVNVTDFPIQPLLEEVIASSGSAATAKYLGISFVETSAIVHSDRMLLGRMLRNLVNNAVRYTETGQVQIACYVVDGSSVDCGATTMRAMLGIEVCDTGVGIAAADLESIFEEFQQLHNPERDRSQGLGLGLSIVKRLARILGHRLRVTSDLGRGSCFSVEIPWVGEASALHPPRPTAVASASIGAGRLALIIDDDDAILAGLELILEDVGFDVIAGADREAALAGLAEDGRIPDIIVADYRLRAGVVGTDVIVEAWHALGRRTPAILLTGESGIEARLAAEHIGVRVIVKPVRPEHLIEAIRVTVGSMADA